MILESYEEAKRAIDAFALAETVMKFNPDEPRGRGGKWIHAGESDTSAFHGKKVSGLTASGNEVKGTYDANRKQVTDKFGGRLDVTHIRAEEPPPKPAVDYSHLPAGLRQGISQYERDVASGRIGFGPIAGFPQTSGSFANRYPGHAGSEAGIRSFVGSHRPLTMAVVAVLMKTYEEAKAEIQQHLIAQAGASSHASQ